MSTISCFSNSELLHVAASLSSHPSGWMALPCPRFSPVNADEGIPSSPLDLIQPFSAKDAFPVFHKKQQAGLYQRVAHHHLSFK